MKRGKKTKNMKVITRFCHVDEHCCPQLCLDKEAESSKEIVVIDDFGGSVRMSKDQIRAFIKRVRNGEIQV